MYKIIAIALLAVAPLSAALPPLHQSLKEWQKILESKEITNSLGPNETIQSVIRSGDSFTIRSQEQQIIVDLIYIPSQMAGPRQFKLVFHNPTPIDQDRG